MNDPYREIFKAETPSKNDKRTFNNNYSPKKDPLPSSYLAKPRKNSPKKRV
ncbi:hypothetical protein GCM10007049_20790 [Echinicola pacifica]|uniref:Uncharacterized protein n=1 Tax=Echinicola pacifica TaxID=346377 RepID=A0A918PYP1_9BACT|nr:hypothetical protein GCM10007049_20790 [Echinicola pacifica]